MSSAASHLHRSQLGGSLIYSPTTSSKPSSALMVASAVETAEPATGIKFPQTIKPPGCAGGLSLLGLGVREKKIAILNIKVYGVGIYADDNIVDSLKAWNGKSAAAIENDPAFFKAIATGEGEKAISIVLARDLESKQFWDAIAEALVPRLKAAGAGPAGDKALSDFGAVFKSASLKQNTSILLSWALPSTLYITITNGSTPPSAPTAAIESQDLLTALFDVYLGSSTVSPSVLSSIATKFGT